MSRFLLQVQSTSASPWMLHRDKMQSHELFIWPAFHTPSFVLFPFSFSSSALPSSLINLFPFPFSSTPSLSVRTLLEFAVTENLARLHQRWNQSRFSCPTRPAKITTF